MYAELRSARTRSELDAVNAPSRLVPAGAHAGGHDFHERFHGVDLAAVHFELFPYDESVAGAVRIGLAEIHAEEHDALLFVHGRNAGGDEGMLHDLLCFDVLAAGPRAPGPGRDDAVFNAVGIGREGSIDSHEAADFEAGGVELRDPDGILA